LVTAAVTTGHTCQNTLFSSSSSSSSTVTTTVTTTPALTSVASQDCGYWGLPACPHHNNKPERPLVSGGGEQEQQP
jgi:hypothetical protein